MNMLLRKLLVNGGYMAPADDDGGTGGNGADAVKAAAEKAAAEKAAAEKAAADKAAAEAAAAKLLAEEEERKKNGKQTTDAEAKLLKEVMEKKDALKKADEALKQANARLKEFDGIDPAAVKKLLAEQKDAEEKKLAAEGNWDALKKQMNEAHAKELAAKDTAINALNDQTKTLNEQIADLTVGHTFSSSKFVQEEMALTPGKARVVYGGHFEFKDGVIVAFDKPVGKAGRTMLVDGKGEPLDFEAAMKKIVDADADRDQLLKSKLKPGAASGTNNRGKPGEPQEKSSQTKISEGLKALGKR